ncbi:unnamed protein product [Rotaria socialis]|uniref:Endonuclease/exonuclease/phosphatase domain-containing protein n=1 Tax=Rotaria socialis TaxID=392032 RepID=A0A818B363_9BILA|nr:unnamed protein product [Rotaria socialis]
MYAPESKSWNWKDLTNLISNKCIILGDFNVDMNNDTQSSEALLEWADACSLAPCIPDAATSVRSDHTIDYALSNGVPFSIQTYKGGSSSDHKPILSTLSCGMPESTTAAMVTAATVTAATVTATTVTTATVTATTVTASTSKC